MNKWKTLAIVWIGVIAAYIIMAAAMPAIRDISTASAAAIAASGNMTEQPGIQGAVASASVWLWFIPGPLGLVVTAFMLKFGDRT